MLKGEIKKKLKSNEFMLFLKKRLDPLISKKSIIRKNRKEIKEESDNAYIQIEGIDPENKKFYDLDGVIAGGAVANLAMEYLFSIPAVINDVDFFYYQFNSKTKEELTAMDGEIYLSTGNDEDFNYSIKKVKKNRKENFINIEISYDFLWKDLLNSFDLNCCQIMIHWNEEEVVWTEDFLSFLEKRVILPAQGFNKVAPITSIIRGIQKTKDLDSKFFINDLVIDSLIKPWLGHLYEKGFKGIKVGNKPLDSDIIVYKKKINELKNNPNILGEFFVYKKGYLIFNQENNYSWNRFFKGIVDIKISGIERESGFHSSFFIVDEIIKSDKIVDRIFLSTKADLNKFKALLETEAFPSSTAFELFLDKKLEQYKKEDLALLKKMHKHEGLYFASSILLGNENIQWSFNDYISFLKELKKEPLEIYGIFETLVADLNFYSIRNVKEKSFLDDFKSKNYKLIIEKLHIIFEEQKRLNKLKDPELIKPFQRWVKEITDLPSLREEGRAMKHCVGGYADKVRDKKSLIFHIKSQMQETTLEIKIKDGRYSRGQHKTKLNKRPVIKHQKIAERLVKYLNFYNG